MDEDIPSQHLPTASDDPWESLAATESDLATDPADVGLEFEVESSPADASLASPEPIQLPSPPAIPRTTAGGGCWTIPLLCAGVALIACCLLIPQADANRRIAYERLKLAQDLESIRKQVAVNDEFLKQVADNPNLAERLAQRQMKIIREGTKVLELKHAGARAAPEGEQEMSPFHLVNVAPPPPLPPYRPLGGFIARLCYAPRSRLYLMGGGLMAVAAGLVLGYGVRFW
jgi:hypothetical protein